MEDIRDRIEEEFENSDELAYWQKRNAEESEDCNVYHRYRKHPEAKKRQCRNKLEFKDHHKWYGYDHKYLDYETFRHEDSADFDRHATHHRIYCIESRKSKFLFETQEKADHFIKSNHEAIVRDHGYAPVRSYYCPMCAGWHVTHIFDYALWRKGWKLSEFVEEKFAQMAAEAEEAPKEQADEQTMEQQPPTEEQLQEMHLQEYLEKTRQRFAEEKRLFDSAFSVYDLKTCKKIQENFRQLLTEDETLRGHVDDIMAQLDEMLDHIRSLRLKIIAAQEDERRFIGDLQTGFKQKFHVFRQAYIKGDLETCLAFYNAVTQALTDCQYSGKFLTKLREREAAMRKEIEELRQKQPR